MLQEGLPPSLSTCKQCSWRRKAKKCQPLIFGVSFTVSCISPDRQPPLKRVGGGRDHRTPRVSLVQKHEYFTYLHPYSPPLPPPPISSPLILRLSAFAFHMPGWLGDAAPCNSSQAPAREAVAMAIWHRGIFFPSAFFSPLSPTFNDAAASAACLGLVYFSVQHHDYHSRPSLAGTVCLCTSFMCRMFVAEN